MHLRQILCLARPETRFDLRFNTPHLQLPGQCIIEHTNICLYLLKLVHHVDWQIADSNLFDKISNKMFNDQKRLKKNIYPNKFN